MFKPNTVERRRSRTDFKLPKQTGANLVKRMVATGFGKTLQQGERCLQARHGREGVGTPTMDEEDTRASMDCGETGSLVINSNSISSFHRL
jgi:hypothetical protein